MDDVGEGDGDLLVSVVEQLGDDEPVEEVPGLDDVGGHAAHPAQLRHHVPHPRPQARLGQTHDVRGAGGVTQQTAHIASVHSSNLVSTLMLIYDWYSEMQKR